MPNSSEELRKIGTVDSVPVTFGWQFCLQDQSLRNWDNLLISLGNYSIFQSYLWGEHKKKIGDRVVRLMYGNHDGQVVAMIQILFKKILPGLYIGWCPGGVSGELDVLNKDLISFLKKKMEAQAIYLRFSFHRKFDENDKIYLLKNKFLKSKITIAGELSMSFFPSKKMEDLLSGLKGNWRHNLKRGYKQDFIISSPSVINQEEVIALYRSLEKIKNIPEQYSSQEMMSILGIFKEKIKIYFAHSRDGQILALRACVLLGKKGFDFLAATSEEGRKKYASYVLFWEVVKHCHESEIEDYNMMGIDPKNNPGVFNFKQGTGAQVLPYLGEWELGPFWISLLINIRLYFGKLKSVFRG